jgi:hypothetical protein
MPHNTLAPVVGLPKNAGSKVNDLRSVLPQNEPEADQFVNKKTPPGASLSSFLDPISLSRAGCYSWWSFVNKSTSTVVNSVDLIAQCVKLHHSAANGLKRSVQLLKLEIDYWHTAQHSEAYDVRIEASLNVLQRGARKVNLSNSVSSVC